MGPNGIRVYAVIPFFGALLKQKSTRIDVLEVHTFAARAGPYLVLVSQYNVKVSAPDSFGDKATPYVICERLTIMCWPIMGSR